MNTTRAFSTNMTVTSNVGGVLLVDILSYARLEPQVLQVELHPYLTQEPLLRLAKTLGIAVTAYSSFGPQSYLELGFKGTVKPLFERDPIVNAARAHQKGLSFLVWHMNRSLRGTQSQPKFSYAGRRRGELQSSPRQTRRIGCHLTLTAPHST